MNSTGNEISARHLLLYDVLSDYHLTALLSLFHTIHVPVWCHLLPVLCPTRLLWSLW